VEELREQPLKLLLLRSDADSGECGQ
jgi:hypothetical protein